MALNVQLLLHTVQTTAWHSAHNTLPVYYINTVLYLSYIIQSCAKKISAVFIKVSDTWACSKNYFKDADGTIIKDSKKQLDRWFEHYNNFYGGLANIQPKAVESLPKLDLKLNVCSGIWLG